MKKIIIPIFLLLSITASAGAVSYQKVAPLALIIDPGHGGADGGAISVTGKKESEINLDICLRCEQLAAFIGFSPILTRYSEDIDYPPEITTVRERKVWDQHERLSLINSFKTAFFISIHQNKYSSSGPQGAQVFYNGAESKRYADLVTEGFFSYINKDKKRTAKEISKDIYLLNKAKCPAVLIECGFLSNSEDAHMLEQAEHQKLLTSIIIGSFCRYYSQIGGAS